MPIFEFQCQACQHRFDVLQKASAPAPAACPECGRLGPEKCLSAPSFQLQGKDWRKPAKRSSHGAPRVRKIGHTLDSAPPHSHDDPPARERGRPDARPPAGSHGVGHSHDHSHDHKH
jgi:putative FmdB family regulatory protein